MRRLGFVLFFALISVACDEPPPTQNSVAETAESAKTQVPPSKERETTQPSATPIQKLPDEKRDHRPVDEMNDQELEVACFEGRTEACDLLGH